MRDIVNGSSPRGSVASTRGYERNANAVESTGDVVGKRSIVIIKKIGHPSIAIRLQLAHWGTWDISQGDASSQAPGKNLWNGFCLCLEFFSFPDARARTPLVYYRMGIQIFKISWANECLQFDQKVSLGQPSLAQPISIFITSNQTTPCLANLFDAVATIHTNTSIRLCVCFNLRIY